MTMTTDDETTAATPATTTPTTPTTLDPETRARVEELASALVPPRPSLVEPEEDEIGDDLIFVRNGWLRVTVGGTEYKLRRPFLGELRDLELTRETDIEALRAAQQDMRQTTDSLLERARAIEEEARALNGEQPERKRVLDIEATDLGLTAQRASLKLIRDGQDRRAAWWEQVFKTLTPPGHTKPSKSHYPAWVGDAVVQQRVIEHWQASPLAPGGG